MIFKLETYKTSNKWILNSFVVLYGILLFFQSYFVERTDFVPLIFLLAGLSLFYLLILANRDVFSVQKTLISSSFLIAICLFSDASLSNDYFRFLWDGELLNQGINPYDFKPNDLMVQQEFYSKPYFVELHKGMGELSARHYSCYPPVNQFFFWISTLFTNSITLNVLLLKCTVLASTGVGVYYLLKLLVAFHLEKSRISILLFNPLFIIETFQNVHFEAVMISFLLVAFYFIFKSKLAVGSLFFAFAIQIKLIPLLIFPFLLKLLGFKKSLLIWSITILFNVLFFASLIRFHNYENFIISLKLYFKNFEFNSSIFITIQYITKFKFYESIGSILSFISGSMILFFAFSGNKTSWNKFFKKLTLSFFIYYLFSSTVHPWYLLVPLVFSVFTDLKFMLVWSLLVFLSYIYYAFPPNDLLIFVFKFLQYFSFLLFLVFEIWKIKK